MLESELKSRVLICAYSTPVWSRSCKGLLQKLPGRLPLSCLDYTTAAAPVRCCSRLFVLKSLPTILLSQPLPVAAGQDQPGSRKHNQHDPHQTDPEPAFPAGGG